MARTKRKTNPLSLLLEKRGIDNVADLSPEERSVYDRYNLILTGESVTTDTIKAFCRAQLAIIEGKCDGVTPLTNLQQACMHVYINLLKAIEAPEAERESLEKYLNQIVNS